MSAKSEYVIERTLDVDQILQTTQLQHDQYHQSRSPTTTKPRGNNSNEVSEFPAPLPQVRRVKPQSMMRTNSRVTIPADADESYGDEGYHTGFSEQSSVKSPRISRKRPERELASRNGTIMEETRIGAPSGNLSTMTDFFSSEVFHIVLHNPTTAHRFLRFCQSRACGENIEFLQKV